MPTRPDLRAIASNVKEAFADMDRETLLDILTFVIKEYVVEGPPPMLVHQAETLSDLKGAGHHGAADPLRTSRACDVCRRRRAGECPCRQRDAAAPRRATAPRTRERAATSRRGRAGRRDHAEPEAAASCSAASHPAPSRSAAARQRAAAGAGRVLARPAARRSRGPGTSATIAASARARSARS